MEPNGKPSYSGRLLRKGAFVEETYQIFGHWTDGEDLKENLKRIQETNLIGASNESWLKEVCQTLSNRFSHGDSIEPLVTLARQRFPLDQWKFCLLWHFGSTDGIFGAFAKEMLFSDLNDGIEVLSTDHVSPFVEEIYRTRLKKEISQYGRIRMARDLLRMGADFDLLEGTPHRRFRHAHIPDEAVLYAVYSLMDQTGSAHMMLQSDRWRLFLMGQDDVERELMNLHQFNRLRYESAGTVRELSLPFSNLAEYAQSLVS